MNRQPLEYVVAARRMDASQPTGPRRVHDAKFHQIVLPQLQGGFFACAIFDLNFRQYNTGAPLQRENKVNPVLRLRNASKCSPPSHGVLLVTSVTSAVLKVGDLRRPAPITTLRGEVFMKGHNHKSPFQLFLVETDRANAEAGRDWLAAAAKPRPANEGIRAKGPHKVAPGPDMGRDRVAVLSQEIASNGYDLNFTKIADAMLGFFSCGKSKERIDLRPRKARRAISIAEASARNWKGPRSITERSKSMVNQAMTRNAADTIDKVKPRAANLRLTLQLGVIAVLIWMIATMPEAAGLMR